MAIIGSDRSRCSRCAAALLVSLWAATAAAQNECLPDTGQDLYFCDPLDNGTTLADRIGGAFIGDGWQVGAFNDRLLYDLGVPADAGTIRFHVRGIDQQTLNQGTGPAVHHHLMEMWDDGHGGSGAAYATKIRTWGDTPDEPAGWWGRLRFMFTSYDEALVVDCGGEDHVNAWDTGYWDGEWMMWEVEFGGGTSEFRVDGQTIGAPVTGGADLADCSPGTPVLRYLYVPLQPRLPNDIDSVQGSVYSHVSFSGHAATCFDPCDDGNQCTDGGYHCEEGVCVGTPLPDGTDCDDLDPGTEDDQCVEGICVGTEAPGDDDTTGDDDSTGDDDDTGGDDDTGDDDDAGADDDSGGTGCGCRLGGGGGPAGMFVLACVGLLMARRR